MALNYSPKTEVMSGHISSFQQEAAEHQEGSMKKTVTQVLTDGALNTRLMLEKVVVQGVSAFT